MKVNFETEYNIAESKGKLGKQINEDFFWSWILMGCVLRLVEWNISSFTS